MKAGITVSISQKLLQTIFEGARRLYPKETILLLRGEKKRNVAVYNRSGKKLMLQIAKAWI